MQPMFFPDSVDETANYTEMQGPSSTVNQLSGKAAWSQDATKSLIVVWVLALGLLWGLGIFFRGQRS